MKAHVEPSCQGLFGLWLSPWIYTWSYSEISAERSHAFLKRLYLCYSDSDVENPHFYHEKINVQSCELSNKRRPNLKLTLINTVSLTLYRFSYRALAGAVTVVSLSLDLTRNVKLRHAIIWHLSGRHQRGHFRP